MARRPLALRGAPSARNAARRAAPVRLRPHRRRRRHLPRRPDGVPSLLRGALRPAVPPVEITMVWPKSVEADVRVVDAREGVVDVVPPRKKVAIVGLSAPRIHL